MQIMGICQAMEWMNLFIQIADIFLVTKNTNNSHKFIKAKLREGKMEYRTAKNEHLHKFLKLKLQFKRVRDKWR